MWPVLLSLGDNGSSQVTLPACRSASVNRHRETEVALLAYTAKFTPSCTTDKDSVHSSPQQVPAHVRLCREVYHVLCTGRTLTCSGIHEAPKGSDWPLKGASKRDFCPFWPDL